MDRKDTKETAAPDANLQLPGNYHIYYIVCIFMMLYFILFCIQSETVIKHVTDDAAKLSYVVYSMHIHEVVILFCSVPNQKQLTQHVTDVIILYAYSLGWFLFRSISSYQNTI